MAKGENQDATKRSPSPKQGSDFSDEVVKRLSSRTGSFGRYELKGIAEPQEIFAPV